MPGDIENRRFNRIETEDNHHYCKEWGHRPLCDEAHSGFIKCKLAHAEEYSVIVPDQIYLVADELSWIQPLSFTANVLAVVDDDIVCDLYMDISLGQPIRVRFFQSGFVRDFDDGSQLFHCTIYGPSDLVSFTTGPAHRTDEGLSLQLFHHTTPQAKELILSSCNVRGSGWNIQGNKELTNVCYAYFTCLDRICFENDLREIAMVTDGHFCLMRDNFEPPPRITAADLHRYGDDILHLDVYRSATADRADTIALWIGAATLAPHHILKHCPNGAAVYYEICSPFIHRVGLEPKKALAFDKDSLTAIADGQALKCFDYMIIGDATCVTGLRAPFDEEETECLFKIERPGKGQSILEFWVTNPNIDHYTGNSPDLQRFQPSKE